jgi:glucose/arabinose dehydrogenase
MLERPIRCAIAALIAASGAAACRSDDARAPGTSAATVAATSEPAESPRPGVTPGGYAASGVFAQIDFDRMVALIPIPSDDGHAVVLTQQDGVIYRASLVDESGEPSVFLDLRGKMTDEPANEEGLLGLAFSPQFETDRRFFVHYTGAGQRRTVIERYTVADGAAAPASGHVILEVPQPFPNHNGGSIEFGPDGYLYLALGDGGAAGDPQGNGQNRDVLLGKILRIDVSGDAYTIPLDNPFAQGGGRSEIWAFGLRNPWRMTFDRETGDLWAGDVGQGEWEEVDRIAKGANYGWSEMEGPDCFREDPCENEGMVLPRAAYGTHDDGACSVTGGYVYRGASMPELDGWYVYGDFCSGRVWALDTTNEVSGPIVLMDSGKQISSFAQDTTGELYLVTFARAVYRLVRR